MTIVTAPAPLFTDASGDPLDDGYIYIGSDGLDARTNPITVYWDEDLTTPAVQPIRTSGGYPTYQGIGKPIFVNAAAISMTVLDKYQRVNFNTLSLTLPAFDLQPVSGAGNVGFSHAETYPSSTVGKKLQQFIDPRDAPYNAAGDGTTDDYTALSTALATGKMVWLQPGITYAFGTQLAPPDNGGFVGGGKLKMLTSSGKFDRATYGGSLATNQVGIYINGKTNVTVEAVVEMESNASIRTVSPIAVRSSTNIKLDMEVSGFKEAEFPLVAWDTNVGGFVRLYAHDCTPNSTSLASMQLTALGIDYNRISSVNSTGLIFDVIAKNIRLGASARVTYGEQTDAVNIQGLGFTGMSGRIYAETVGEAFDCFGDNNNVTVVAKNCYAYGVKLIHGASYNQVTATVDGTVGHALVYGGSSSAGVTKSVQYNDCRVTAVNVGTLTGGAAIVNASGVATDGTSATHKPANNRTWINAFGDGAGMKYVVFEESGSNNVYEADGTGWATQFGSVTSSAGSGNIIRRKRNTHIRAYIGTATTVTNGSAVPYDTESYDATGEYDNSTYTATVTCEGRYRVYAQIRAPSITSLANFGLQVVKNGSEVARSTPINFAASAREMYVSVFTVVECNPGDTIAVYAVESEAGSPTVTNNSAYSYLEIEQI